MKQPMKMRVDDYLWTGKISYESGERTRRPSATSRKMKRVMKRRQNRKLEKFLAI